MILEITDIIFIPPFDKSVRSPMSASGTRSIPQRPAEKNRGKAYTSGVERNVKAHNDFTMKTRGNATDFFLFFRKAPPFFLQRDHGSCIMKTEPFRARTTRKTEGSGYSM